MSLGECVRELDAFGAWYSVIWCVHSLTMLFALNAAANEWESESANEWINEKVLWREFAFKIF